MKIWLESRNDWFVLPVFKSQMVYLLSGWYPDDVNKFKRMSCRQLRAIICRKVKGNLTEAGLPIHKFGGNNG